MLTRMGGLGSASVPGGDTGTGAHDPSRRLTSSPAWPRSRKRRVMLP